MRKFSRMGELITQQQKKYFTYIRGSQQEIADANLRLLHLCGILAAALTAAYYVFTVLVFPHQGLSHIYLLPAPGFVLFTLYAAGRKRSHTPSWQVSLACCLFMGLLGLYCIALSVFAHPDAPEVFFSLFLMLLPALFILRAVPFFALLLGGEGLFALLALRFKSPAIVPHDLFATVTAMLFSTVVFGICYWLRSTDNLMKQHYRTLSSIDSLTGILNKGACEQLCQDYLSSRQAGDFCALMVLDLDDFKRVNDLLGHSCGDLLLKRLGTAMRQLFRESDIMGRIGGDEFLVLLKHISQEDVLLEKAAAIRAAVHSVFQQYEEIQSTCSIGIAVSPAVFISYDELFELADMALYDAKSAGKGGQVLLHATGSLKREENKKLMLIADDSPINRRILANIFSNDFQIIEAADGEAALLQVVQYGSDLSIILLDIVMPRTDGYTVLNFLSAKPRYRNIPVLAVTADAQNEARALSMGADDLIVKPIDPAVARLRVSNLLRGRK